MSAWELAESFMNSRQVLDPTETDKLGCVLAALHSSKITHVDASAKGTQLKVMLTLEGGQRAVFKPKSYDRDFVMVGTAFAGKDRHNAEIAAFHLNRILGFNSAPVVVGRKVDMESDLRPVAHKSVLDTYYYQGGNSCFYGKCHYCKGPETGVCASRTTLEGSVSLWFPESYTLGKVVLHPWRRTYRTNRPAIWETDPNYCEKVRSTRPYELAHRLLDLIDVAIFDFIDSNADRHRYETFEYSKNSIVIALDNGKSFGNPYSDEESILAPLYQCCTVRMSTYARLSDLKDGVLGQVLFNVLETEALAPLLTPQHYIAVDRRLHTVLNTINKCIRQASGDRTRVLISDSGQ